MPTVVRHTLLPMMVEISDRKISSAVLTQITTFIENMTTFVMKAIALVTNLITFVMKAIALVTNLITFVMKAIALVTNLITFVMKAIAFVTNITTFVMKAIALVTKQAAEIKLMFETRKCDRTIF